MQRSPFGSRFGAGSWRLLPVFLVGACASVEHDPLLQATAQADLGADLANVAAAPTIDASSPPDAATSDGPALTTCDMHKLRINELSTAGPAGATDEFIELYNPCNAAVSLYGASLAYRAATSGGDNFVIYAFAAQSVPAHGYFVVANGAFTGTADLKPFQNGAGLAAAGGGVALKDPADAVIDSVGWGTAVNAYVEAHVVAAPASGDSIARSSDGVDSNDNAADFKLGTPTPGAAN